MPGSRRRAPKQDFPDFNMQERQRIACLIHRRDHLVSRADAGNKFVQAEADALTWFINWLKDDSVADDPIHIAALVRYREYWAQQGGLTGFQLEELGAISWAIKEIDGDNLRADD